MKRRDGIVIVASLVLMMAVLGLAVGTLFLTQSSLKIAENARTKAVAKFNAEAGTDAVLMALDHYYFQSGGQYPSFSNGSFSTSGSFVAPVIQSGQTQLDYTVQEFNTSADGSSAILRVAGTGGNNAIHVTEVLMAGQVNANTVTMRVNPLTINGLSSEGTITLNGRSNFVSAGLHGNAGYTMNAFSNTRFSTCVERNNNTGRCVRSEDITVDQLPVSAAADRTSWTCNPNDPAVCVGGVPVRLIDPIVVTPDFVNRRNDAIADADRAPAGTYSSVFGINCDLVLTNSPTMNHNNNVVPAGFVTGRTVCVENGNVTFPSGTSLAGITIIARNSIQFNGNTAISIRNSSLISQSGCVTINPNRITIDSSRIYSNCDLNLNGQQSSFEGVTTLASASSITVNGSSRVVKIDDAIGIGLSLIAEGNVTINGQSDWFAMAVAGGGFTYNGNSVLHGGIMARNNITVNGGIDIDSGLSMFNTDFLQEQVVSTVTQRLTEYSRR